MTDAELDKLKTELKTMEKKQGDLKVLKAKEEARKSLIEEQKATLEKKIKAMGIEDLDMKVIDKKIDEMYTNLSAKLNEFDGILTKAGKLENE